MRFIVLLLFCFSVYAAETNIQINGAFSETEKDSVQKIFSTLAQLKGTQASDAFNAIFNPDYKFEGVLSGKLLVDFIEARVKIIDALDDSQTQSQSSSSHVSYSKSAHVLPRIVESTDGARHIIRDTVSFNKKHLDGKMGNILLLWGVLIHEAFHADLVDEHAHINCPDVMLSVIEGSNTPAGLPVACDADEDGSYGIEAIFWGNVIVNAQGLSEGAKDAAKYFFGEALNHISSRDAQYRVLDDLGLDEKLQTKFVPKERKEYLNIDRDLRLAQKKMTWEEKQKATSRRNEQEREAFRSFLANKDRALTVYNYVGSDVVFHYRWGKGEWIKKELKVNENFLLRNSSTDEVKVNIVFEPYQIDPVLRKKLFNESVTVEALPFPRGQKEFYVARYDFRRVDLGPDPHGMNLYKLALKVGGHTRFKE